MPRPVEIQISQCERDILLRRHDFFVTQAKSRLLAQFSDIAGEAERYADAEYERLGAMPGDGSMDMSDIANMAIERAQVYFCDLDDLAKQTTLSTLAAMYHQWEKTLRDLNERELARFMGRDAATKIAWHTNIGELYSGLALFGWDCRKEAFFPLIDACRLIVNVYKHGKGPSLTELAQKYPQYLRHPFALADGSIPGVFVQYWDHEWLSVTTAQFDEISDAFRSFWNSIPHDLSCTV
jgi:hypothetical protein